MKYVGLQKQISSNNRKSILLILAFPLLILAMVFVLVFIGNYDSYYPIAWSDIFFDFFAVTPFVLVFVGIWFLIAYYANTKIIQLASNSKPLTRTENMRVYNLVENLCMSVGMKTPKIEIIESQALNAFASGINDNTYTVTLTRGIIEKLEDDELEGVIAHELAHIRNHDVKLLIISIIFVGIFSFIMQLSFRLLLSSSNRRSKNDKGGGAAILLVLLVLSVLAYFFSFLFKMALSRKREYLADAGAVEMTKNPLALANALSKISGNSAVENIASSDVKQLFIDNTPKKNLFSGITNLFSTHPPIEKRIAFLRQM